MDKELFELCKVVYERFPEWQIEDAKFFVNDFGTIETLYAAEILPPAFIVCPLYTSDYLLERLPLRSKRIEDTAMLGRATNNNGWSIVYGDMAYLADTPLKALLKLVIALDDAGQLVAAETTA